ncbi:MAG: hypothetical protein ACKVPX_14900 [Myxococcaceae bacterium]
MQHVFATVLPPGYSRDVARLRDLAQEARLPRGKPQRTLLSAAPAKRPLAKAVESLAPVSEAPETLESQRDELLALLRVLHAHTGGRHSVHIRVPRNFAGPELFQVLDALHRLERLLLARPELRRIYKTNMNVFIRDTYGVFAKAQAGWRTNVIAMLRGEDPEATPIKVCGVRMSCPPGEYVRTLRKRLARAAAGTKGPLLARRLKLRIYPEVALAALDLTPDALHSPESAAQIFDRLAWQFDDNHNPFKGLADVCRAATWKPSQEL